jgi:hypothetical protein
MLGTPLQGQRAVDEAGYTRKLPPKCSQERENPSTQHLDHPIRLPMQYGKCHVPSFIHKSGVFLAVAVPIRPVRRTSSYVLGRTLAMLGAGLGFIPTSVLESM